MPLKYKRKKNTKPRNLLENKQGKNPFLQAIPKQQCSHDWNHLEAELIVHSSSHVKNNFQLKGSRETTNSSNQYVFVSVVYSVKSQPVRRMERLSSQCQVIYSNVVGICWFERLFSAVNSILNETAASICGKLFTDCFIKLADIHCLHWLLIIACSLINHIVFKMSKLVAIFHP